MRGKSRLTFKKLKKKAGQGPENRVGKRNRIFAGSSWSEFRFREEGWSTDQPEGVDKGFEPYYKKHICRTGEKVS